MLRMNRINANGCPPFLYLGEARWLQRQGRAEDAIALLSLAEQRGLKSVDITALATTLLEEVGRGAEASALRMSRINAGAGNSNMFVDEARWLHAQGRSEEALSLLSLAEQRGLKNDHVAHYKLGLLEQLGQTTDAAAVRRERINAGSRTASFYMAEAYWLHAQGRSEEAMDLLTLAEQRGIRSDHLVAARAGLLERMGRGMEASMLRRTCMKTYNRSPALYTGEALWLHGQGRTDEALGLLEEAEQNGATLDSLAHAKAAILEALNRGTEASKILESLGRSPGTPESPGPGYEASSPVIEASEAHWIDSQEEQGLDELSSDEQEPLSSSKFELPEPTLLEELEPQDDPE
ncbi:MAG TPA: hypothetical protein VNA24_10805 [Hyalangium sp.]|nr:hypothetical protein [Hyalangium sp.]